MKTDYVPPRVIYVDVDGTLIVHGKPNTMLIQWLRQRASEGYEINLWSMRGKEYASNQASAYECGEIFNAILSKPGFIVDDIGWSWIRHSAVVKPSHWNQQ